MDWYTKNMLLVTKREGEGEKQQWERIMFLKFLDCER